MMESLRAVISCPVPEQVPCTEEYLSKALMGMAAVLPRQGKDAASGALMMKQYQLKLGKHPKGAIDYLWSKAVDRLQWFPTIAECNSIISEWVSKAQEIGHAKSAAGARLERETSLRFRDAMDVLRFKTATQADVDYLPAAWKKHAVALGRLWELTDGTHIPRPDMFDMTEGEREEYRERLAKLREEGLL